MIDKKENYYSFMHPNKWIKPESFEHRLGKFQCEGIATRAKPVKIIILHIPDYSRVFNGIDYTAEDMAQYLSNPPEGRTYASVHEFSDTDSFVLFQPSDTQCYGCANSNTGQESIEIEIAGTFKDHANPEYWRTDEALKKLKNTVAGLKQLQLLCPFEMPPLQIGEVNQIGQVIKPGFLQHRDIPIYRNGKWYQKPESFAQGQHEDICEGFPYDVLFGLF